MPGAADTREGDTGERGESVCGGALEIGALGFVVGGGGGGGG